MPKQIININNFGRGINDVKNPRDLSIGEAVSISNFDTLNAGELRPRGNFKTATNGQATKLNENFIDSQTASLNPGYGLYYFESDDVVGVRGVTFTASGAVSSSTNSGTNIIFNAGNDYIYINNNDFWTENNVLSSITSFPVKIIISGTSSNNGTFTIVGVGNVLTDPEAFTLQGSTWSTSGNLQNAYIQVSESLTDENVSASTSVSIERVGFVGDSFLALGNVDDGKVDIFTDSLGSFSNDKITVLGTADTNEVSEFVYHYVDSSLRVADGNFRNESTPRWYGFIDRTQFEFNTGTSTEGVRNTILPAFYEEDNDLSKPSEVKFTPHGSIDGTTEFTTSSSGRGWGISVLESTEDGNHSSGVYEFGGTFIYDGNQESLVTKASTTLTIDGFKRLLFNVYAYDDGSTFYNRRVSGGRIYWRDANSKEPWILFADIDIRRGVRASLQDEFKGWIKDTDGKYRVTSDTTSANRQNAYWLLDASSTNLESYESINGFSPNVAKQIAFGKLGSGYKTSVIANRRAFVANVLYDDNKTGSSQDNTDFEHYGDRIMFSEIGKYDLFPDFNFIDVVKGDGEDYVKLEYFADRLFAYKQRTLQILNVSSPSPSNWFLEDTMQGAGVSKPYSVCKGSLGVFWANKSGLYHFNGSAIRNVINGKIDSNTWSTFLNNKQASLGYIANSNQVVVMQKVTSSIDAYIYQIETDSFVFGDDISPNSSSSFVPNISNFVNDSLGNLLLAYDVQSTDLNGNGANKVHITKWDTGEGEHKVYKLETPDLHLNNTASLKKFYKVYIHYRHTDSNAIDRTNVYYQIDQSGTWNTMASGSFTQSGSNYNIAVFKASTYLTFQSIAFKIETDLSNATGLYINDIQVEYRPIKKRVS